MNSEYLLEKSIELIGKFNRFGSKPGLERVSELLHRLENPEKDLKVIHVAGTNGKGSVCRYLYSVLQKSGYKCGLFISPYIEEFTERIEYNGAQIAPEDLFRITTSVIEKADEMVKEGLESPTEFEVLTAVAFQYYKEKDVDLAILEVGLGGRGDSTNVVESPLVSCITSISFDHMDYLGDTLGKIAWEKSGIIKKGCPVVYYSNDSEVIDVIEDKAEKSESYSFNCSGFRTEILSDGIKGSEFNTIIEGREYKNIKIGMPGHHQINNALCALKIFEILKREEGFNIPDTLIREGMSEARMPGRIEIISDNPMVVLDGSHNRDSILALKNWITSNLKKEDRLLIVTGVLKDKEYEIMAEMLAEVGTDFIVTEPDNPRKLKAEIYKSAIEKYLGNKGNVEAVNDPKKATEKAVSIIKNNNKNLCYQGLIFTGSLYMIGVVRKKIKEIID